MCIRDSTYSYQTKDGREGLKTILMGMQVTVLETFVPSTLDFEEVTDV